MDQCPVFPMVIRSLSKKRHLSCRDTILFVEMSPYVRSHCVQVALETGDTLLQVALETGDTLLQVALETGILYFRLPWRQGYSTSGCLGDR